MNKNGIYYFAICLSLLMSNFICKKAIAQRSNDRVKLAVNTPVSAGYDQSMRHNCIALRKSGNYTAALEAIKPLIDASKSRKRASDFALAGDLYCRMSHWNMALLMFLNAIRLDPQDSGSKLRLVECMLARGNFSGARQYMIDKGPSITDSQQRTKLAVLMKVASKGDCRKVSSGGRRPASNRKPME